MADLLQELRAGSTHALGLCYEQHGHMVYNVCLRILNNTQEAEDACQAVFLLLLQKSKSLRPETHVAGWLFRTATHLSRESLRSEARRKRREKTAAALTETHDQFPEDAPQGEALSAHVDGAVNALPEKYRTAIVMVYYEQLATHDAARRLGIPDGTLRWRLSNAVGKLRDTLQNRKKNLTALMILGLLERHMGAVEPPEALAARFDQPGPLLSGHPPSPSVQKFMDCAPVQLDSAPNHRMRWALCVACVLALLLVVANSLPRWLLASATPRGADLVPEPASQIPFPATTPKDAPSTSIRIHSACPILAAAEACDASTEALDQIARLRDALVLDFAGTQEGKAFLHAVVAGDEAWLNRSAPQVWALHGTAYERFHRGAEVAMGKAVYARFLKRLPSWMKQ